MKNVLNNERKETVGFVFCVLHFEVMFRDCDAEAFGVAAAQNRGRVARVCRVSALAKETVY